MKLLYFGDASWGARALVEIVERGHQVLGVVLRTNPTDGELAEAAESFNLPIYQPKRCNAEDFLQIICKLGPDLNLSVSYDQILRKPILGTAPLGFVNFHAGKLPWYRGRSVINWAIINGEEEIGVTAHFVDEGIDTGDIILQRTLPVAWTDSYADVMRNTVETFVPLVADTVDLLASGKYHRTPQSDMIGSYFPQRGPGDEWLDWSDTSGNLYNKIRGISAPGPGARTLFNTYEMIVWGAEYQPSWPCYIATPGQVVGVEPSGIRIKTGDSTILLTSFEYCNLSSDVQIPKLRIGSKLGVQVLARLHEMQKS